jgi:hypothetical protein
MDRHYQVSITVPDGTDPIAPQTTTVVLENAFLVDVEILIPPGHAGLTGIRIRQSVQQVIPWGNLDWISSDNYERIFPFNSEIGARSMSIQAYNTDVFAHSFQVRFHIRDLEGKSQDAATTAAAILGGFISSGDFTSDNTTPPAPAPIPPPPPPAPPPPPPLP